MTDVSGTPQKVALRRQLFEIGIRVLEEKGWRVERVSGSGKSSVRRIVKGSERKVVSIRTSQDRWIAFPRNKTDQGWVTLSEVDAVVAVSVDDQEEPQFALVHVIEGDEMRDRFDRAYSARKEVGHTIPLGRGMWISLYEREAREPTNRVGAGAGLVYPPIARVPLSDEIRPQANDEYILPPQREAPLTIIEAKRQLALTFGVDPENVKITIEA